MKKIYLLCILLLPVLSNAQILTFEFAGLAGSETSANSATNDANLTSSTIIRGSGITAAANADRFNSTGWTTSATPDLADYVEFTITPNSGIQFSITSIEFKNQRSGTGPVAFELRSSHDSYTATLGSFTVPDGTATQTNTMTLSGESSLQGRSTAVTFRLYGFQSEAAAGTWGPGDGTGADITVSGATGVLPIKLLFFNAKQLANKVQLNWSTASEMNNSHFNIERSVDGKEFVSIAEIKGAGNSKEVLNYSFTDESPAKGINYYQLRQTDFDGATSLSKVIAVNMQQENFEILRAVSNNQNINLEIYSPSETVSEVVVMDISGRVVAKENVNLSKGYNTVNISTQNLSTGIHLIRISSLENSVSKKFIF